MHTHLGLVSILLLACSAPATTPDAASPAPTTLGGLGAPCRNDRDCIAGAACGYYTCDFVDPCSATVTNPGSTMTRRYRYDATGRPLGWVDERDGKTLSSDTWTWSDDGRTMTSVSLIEDNLRVDTVARYDARGVLQSTSEQSGGYVDTTTFTWPDGWSCRGATREVRDAEQRLTVTTRHTCGPDGAPLRTDYVADGVVGRTDINRYVQGRLVERVTRFVAPNGPAPTRLELVRDARGVVVETRRDVGMDGSIEQTETFDLSCWVVEPDRIVYRPTP